MPRGRPKGSKNKSTIMREEIARYKVVCDQKQDVDTFKKHNTVIDVDEKKWMVKTVAQNNIIWHTPFSEPYLTRENADALFATMLADKSLKEIKVISVEERIAALKK